MSLISKWFGPSVLLSQEDFDTVVGRDYRRNATIFILFDVFWGIGMTFAMFGTVVPAYMVAIGCSKTLIGLITSFWPYITPAQILISHYFRTRIRKTWLMGSYTLSVTLWLLYSLLFLFFPESLGHNPKIILFSFCMILFMIFCAGNVTLQFSLITDSTPLQKRGSLYGYRFVAQGLAVLLISPAASWLMGRWEEPTNFLMAFVVGCTFYILCFSIVLLVREHRNPQHILDVRNESNSGRLLPTTKAVLWKMLKNKRFLVFMVFSFLFSAAFMLGNFVIVFAKDQLGITGSQVVRFTVIQTLSAAIFCVLLGKLADKVGYKAIYVLQSLLLGSGFLVPIYVATHPGTSIYVTYLGFILYTSGLGVQGMVLMNMLVELFPEENCATVIALYNFILMPFNMAIGPLAGWSIDKTGSYIPVFAVSAGMCLVSTLGFLFVVQEPRKHLKLQTEAQH